jgi:large subunit ribosomal protein L17
MRHARKINHLGRTNTHRKAMLSNMASSLIMHKRISTTLAKAKALRVYVEPLITRSKDDTTHSRRVVFNYLQNKNAVSELFREVSPKIMDRPGGYTRILKTGFRKGDAAETCIIELVDYNENMLVAKEVKTKVTTRRSRRAGKKVATGQTPETENIAETPIKETEAAVVEKETKPELPAVEEEAKTELPVVEEPETAPVAEEAVAETLPAEEAKVETPVVEEAIKEEKKEPSVDTEKEDKPEKSES